MPVAGYLAVTEIIKLRNDMFCMVTAPHLGPALDYFKGKTWVVQGMLTEPAAKVGQVAWAVEQGFRCGELNRMVTCSMHPATRSA